MRKRRIKKVFGSFNKRPFKGKRLCLGSSQNMTHSSPGMCIDRRTNPHSFASPSYSRWTSPSAPRDQTSVSRLRRARSLFQINERRFFRRAAVCIANFKHSKCNKHIIASFQTHAVLARARRRSLWRRSSCAVAARARARGIPPLELRRFFPFPNADVAFQLPLDAYLPACDKHMPLPCDDDQHQHTTYRISLSLLLSYQTYPKAARLASLLPPSPLHAPPASAARPTRKLPTMCLVPRRPPEKETLVWRLLAFVPPFLGYSLQNLRGNSFSTNFTAYKD